MLLPKFLSDVAPIICTLCEMGVLESVLYEKVKKDFECDYYFFTVLNGLPRNSTTF